MKERDDLEDLDVDGRITLRWIFEKWGGAVWTVFICFRIETSGGAVVETLMNLRVP
jgi:hypothetical protein